MAAPSEHRNASARSYGSGARILSVGIAATGLFTFAYFSLASHLLSDVAAKRLDLVWSIMFVIISVIYRPIEQLLSRTIADRRARGLSRQPLRVPMIIQGSFAVAFLTVALTLHAPIRDRVLDGADTLYWVLVVAVLAYAASYFARGWLAGHRFFGLYGGLVLMEALSRVAFAVAVAVGIASGEDAVALGMAAAPFVSLVVVPWAFVRARSATPPAPDDAEHDAGGDLMKADLSLRRGVGFAVSVAGIMLAEQTLLNASVLTVAATAANGALAGIVFNVLLIARAPLQLFQSVQTSLLPHLAGLEATAGAAAFRRAVALTLAAAAGFGVLVAVGLLAVGPPVMSTLFGQHYHYDRLGLAAVGVGMGLHLCAGTLNQAALARGRATAAAGAWLAAALLFLLWLTLPLLGDQLQRAELGYLGATALLAGALGLLYRRPGTNVLIDSGRGAGGSQPAPAAATSSK